MKKKLMSALIATIMLLSMIPSVALGAVEATSERIATQVGNQIGDYYAVDADGALPDENNLKEGSTWEAYDNGAVRVNKTIAATGQENLFDITLQVITSQEAKKVKIEKDAAVLLLIDTSSSMTGSNMSEAAGTRIYDAKEAAKTFVKNFAGVSDRSVKRYVSVLDFNSKAQTPAAVGWTNVAETGANYVTGRIDDEVHCARGTNIHDGLLKSVELFNDATIAGLNIPKYFIFLSDGQPSVCNGSEHKGETSYSSGDHCCHVNSEAAMKGMPDAVTTYAIYLGSITGQYGVQDTIDCDDHSCSIRNGGNGRSIVTWLGEGFGDHALNFDHVRQTGNSDELADIYAAIFEEMDLGAQPWQVVDPSGSSIVFTQISNNDAIDFNSGNIDWDLTVEEAVEDNTITTTYTYTYTYKATLNTLANGFVEDKFYATNGTTQLTYVLTGEGGQVLDKNGYVVNEVTEDCIRYAYFNIPAVKGYLGEFGFQKTDMEGKNIAGAKFLLTHKDGTGCACGGTAGTTWTATSTAGEGDNVQFENIPSGHKYTLTESEAPSGYVASGESYTVSVDYGVVTITDDEGKPVDLDSFAVKNEEKETIDIPVRKTWSDNKPSHSGVKVTLYANGKSTGRTLTLNSYNKWVGVFTDIDRKDANGNEIVYSVQENFSNKDYETTIIGSAEIGFTIHNIHKNYTIVTVNKVWNDGDNQDGIRPASIQVQLKANGTASGSPVTLNEGNNWIYTWENLPVKAGGNVITYTVDEVTVPTGYTKDITGNAANGFTITNSYTPAVTSVSVNKAWVGEADHPSSVTVQLKANGALVEDKIITLNAANNWRGKFENLPVKANGNAIAYTVAETNVPENYESKVTGNAVDGFTITNTLKTTDITVTKDWDDDDDRDGKRPGSVEVQLYADETAYGAPITLNEGNHWTYTWTGLEVYDDGEEIEYTVDETAVPSGYTKGISGNAANGFTITNSYTPETISISGVKTWVDGENQDGIRPNSITVRLMNGNTEVACKTVTAADNWAWTFENLPKYENGEEITYTITEDAVEGYTTEISGYNVTNTHTPAKTEVTVSKAWNDANNQDGKRPASIQVQLKANGALVEDKIITLNAANNWQGKFEDLPVKANGNAIAYTVAEIAVPTGYTQTVGEVTGNAEDGYAVTVANSYTPETIDISGSKTWNDTNDQDGKRPDSITINLLVNGEVVQSKVVTEADGWDWEFKDLPKYANGVAIVYTITEEPVPSYSTVVNGYDVTNSHPVETVDVKGSKTWVDNNNQDGKRPTQITVRLLKNGTAVDSQIVSEETGWAWSFTNLSKYANGQVINYTVTEDAVEGYTAFVDGYDITNTHTPETVDVEGSKTWNDSNDQDRLRPESIIVRLLADGEEIDSVTVTEEDEWAWSFTGLSKYADGEEIVYTITEDEVSGYTTTVSGYDVTNTHTPATIDISGSKTWNDNNNQDGKRPGSITINLLADGEEIDEKTVTAADNWAWTFENLPKYKDGEEIVYTITEDEVANYTTAVNGYNVTNTHTPETVEVSGSKTWEDDDDQDGKRPGSITINLLANNQQFESKTVTANDDWKWEFTNLPKYAGGREITYTINEVSIDGYTTVIKGYDVTNTHNPGKTSVIGSKFWNDEDNQDGKRPESITVKLLADGEVVDSKTVTEKDDWQWSFSDLDEYKDGEEIVYTIEEVEIEGYTTTYDGYNITNSHEPETVTVSGSKTWIDNDNQDGLRPESITVNLLADGIEVNSATVTEEDEWTWSFTNLPKYEAGEEIVYTVAEDAVTGYTSTIAGDAASGFTLTNTHTPETVAVEGSKTWVDNNNQDGKRPESITVRLLADGEEVASKTVSEETGWAWSFTDLPKYANGQVINYTITEDAVTDYTTTVSGYDVTNTHTPETTEVAVAKNWDDKDNQDGIRPGSIIIKLFDGKKQVDAKTITADDNWEYTFTNLPKYREGEEIVYTVTEDVIAGYTTEITGSADEGYTVTNSYTPQVVSVSGSKTWVDAEDQDGKRPESITVNLLADGEEIDEKVVTEADGWAWSFTDLPKFASGKRISYTVTEDEVEGYNAEVNGYSITNTHEPETTSVSGSKTWDDGDNYAGKRPESITVNLYADEEKVCSKVVTEEDGWVWSFTDLPKYKEGEVGVEIKYAVTEEGIEGYKATVDGFDITNSYRNGKLIINKVISGKSAKADDEFTLKLTLKAANALQPAALNNSIFAAVLANVDGAENIVFTRYNSAGEIVASEYKVYYPSQVNEYEFNLKGGEKMIVTQLPDELLKYTVTETVNLGYIDTYSNCEGETYIFGDPVEATVKNHKGGSSNNIVPPPQFGPPKTGDASAIGYAMMSLMAALAAVTGRKR